MVERQEWENSVDTSGSYDDGQTFGGPTCRFLSHPPHSMVPERYSFTASSLYLELILSRIEYGADRGESQE
jgi:hypothetical protein